MNKLDLLHSLFSRHIILWGGEYGRSKSLSLCAFTFLECLLDNKKLIYSNMPLYYPVLEKVKINPLLETKIFDLDSGIKNCIYIMDELHNDVNAKNSMGHKNKYVTNWSVGLRKDKSKLRGSLQFFDTLEKILGLMLEVIIIPTFINKYSNDAQEDNLQRLEKKDFTVNWHIIDKKTQEIFDFPINLYPFLNMYNTKFKPMPLVINHDEYLHNLQKSSKKTYEMELEYNQRRLNDNNENWNEGMREIIINNSDFTLIKELSKQKLTI